MAYAFVTGANVGFAATDTASSSAIDTTGGTILVAHVSSYAGATAPTLSDSKSNTWTGLTQQTQSPARSRIFYVLNPTVGSGHTFTLTGSGFFGTLQVAAFSGADISSPFDVENGAVLASGTSLATGSVTPNQNDSLVIAGICPTDGSSGVISIDGSFTITDQFAWTNGLNEGGALGYLIQTSAAAANPTWSWTGAAAAAATIAAFKPAVGGGGGVNVRTSG